MSYVVNNHLNKLHVLSNKAEGPGTKFKINKHRAYVVYSGGQSRQVIENWYFLGSGTLRNIIWLHQQYFPFPCLLMLQFRKEEVRLPLLILNFFKNSENQTFFNFQPKKEWFMKTLEFLGTVKVPNFQNKNQRHKLTGCFYSS